MLNRYMCPYGFGICFAPGGNCPHWVGTFCELDLEVDDISVKDEEET